MNEAVTAAANNVTEALRAGFANVNDSVERTGKGLTEALGGFMEMSGEDPVFIPFDEFLSKKFLEDPEQAMFTGELVLEDELTRNDPPS